MKKAVALFTAFILLITLFSGCSGNKELNIAFPVMENVRTLDPQYTSSATAKTIAVNCFEGLVAADENGELLPAAADSWQKDGTTYTFRLRSGAVWKLSATAKEGMEGKLPADFAPAVTAHDFVFAFRRLADPNTNAPSAYMFNSIRNFSEAQSGTVSPESIGVKAVSDTVLTIELAWDDPDFLNKLLTPAAMPCNEEFFNACAGRYGLMTKYIMTNGPFYFSRWNTDTSLRITKSDVYNGTRKAQPETVWFYLNSDPAEMNRKLLSGVYTAGNTAISTIDLHDLDKDLTAAATDDTLYALLFNCKHTVPAVKSIRTALLSSIDRELFRSDEKTLADGCLPLTVQNAAPSGIQTDLLPQFSESVAKASLSAGLAALEQSNAQLTVLCTPEYESVLKQQMQQWQKILGVSISVKIQALQEKDLSAAVDSGDFDAALYPLKAESEDLLSFLGKFTTDNAGNPVGFSSAEYDALFSAAANAKDRSEQTAAMNRALSFLSENSVWYPLYYASSYFICKKEVSGIYRFGDENMICFSQATD